MEDDILIDNYLKSLLTEDEEKSFLERLKSDNAFNEKFQLEQQLFNALNEDSWSFAKQNTKEVSEYKLLLKSDELKNLKKTLININSGFNYEKNKKVKTRKLFYYLAAASVVVFLGFQLFFNQGVSNQDLYSEYVGLNDLPSFVSRTDEINKLTEAQKLFEHKKYEDALAIFQSQLDSQEQKANILIYQGISQMQLEKFEDAEQTFNSLIESELLDAEKGYWYKALLYLKQDRVEDSKQILNTIVSDNLYNKSKAEELLKALD